MAHSLTRPTLTRLVRTLALGLATFCALAGCASMQGAGDDLLKTVDNIFAPPATANKADYDLADAQCKRMPGGALISEEQYNACMREKGITPRAGLRAPFVGAAS